MKIIFASFIFTLMAFSLFGADFAPQYAGINNDAHAARSNPTRTRKGITWGTCDFGQSGGDCECEGGPAPHGKRRCRTIIVPDTGFPQGCTWFPPLLSDCCQYASGHTWCRGSGVN